MWCPQGGDDHQDQRPKVEAVAPKSMRANLDVGQTLEIKKIKGTDKWAVSKILK